MTRVFVHQPQYCASTEYFSRLRDADVFVFRDDVQFRKGDWQNRNRIWLHGKSVWLTVPVTGDWRLPIKDKPIAGHGWLGHHIGLIESAYGQGSQVKTLTRAMTTWPDRFLGELALASMFFFVKKLGIDTPVYLASKVLEPSGDPTADLVKLVQHVGGDEYLCGRHSYENYLDLDQFGSVGIKVSVYEWEPVEYEGMPEPNLSIVDLWCRCGGGNANFFT